MIHTVRQHAKFKRFLRRLRLMVPSDQISHETLAVGLLEGVWHFTAVSAFRGDIGKFDDETIAEFAGWYGDAGQFIGLLVECGWLDRSQEHRLIVHDWHEHAPRYIRGNVNKYGGFVTSEHPLGASSKEPPIGASPKEPSPNLTKPNLTKKVVTNVTTSPEPQVAASGPQEPPLLVFPTNGKQKTWEFREQHRCVLADAFPSADVLGMVRQALAWIELNPGRRKTPRGMPRFLYGWVERNQNRGAWRPRDGPNRPQAPMFDYLERGTNP